jgi:hypothetical protein
MTKALPPLLLSNCLAEPADAILGILYERFYDANAHFIRPFDLGMDTITEFLPIVNWAKYLRTQRITHSPAARHILAAGFNNAGCRNIRLSNEGRPTFAPIPGNLAIGG